MMVMKKNNPATKAKTGQEADGLSGEAPYVCGGARPSSGAARLEDLRVLGFARRFESLDVAAPGDGRAPVPFVPQTSKSAVSQVSKPAGRKAAAPTWKSAAQQVWKPALLKIAMSNLLSWLHFVTT
jgi:hypothetical protein